MFKDFADSAQSIQNWVDVGDHMRRETYIAAIANLFQIAQLPIRVEFCTLQAIAGQAPAVVGIPAPSS